MSRSTSSSSSSSTPPLAPSRRQALRAHSDSYHPIYTSSGSSASSDTSSIFSYDSSSSSATSASVSSVPRRPFSRELPHVPRPRPLNRPAAAPRSASVSVPLCSPATGRTQVVLPRNLARPQHKHVSPEALAAAGGDLANVPLPYIIQSLKDIGPRMMATLARTVAPVPTSLPRELDVCVTPDPSPEASSIDTQPTHLLAVYARSHVEATPAHEGAVPRRKVTLFPTHAIVLAAHCAHLPPLPPSGIGKGKEKEAEDLEDVHPAHSEPTTLTLPVVPLCIPAPKMFPVLQAYLYTKRADHLLNNLVPSSPSLHTSSSSGSQDSTPTQSEHGSTPTQSENGSTPRPSHQALPQTPSSMSSTPTPSGSPSPPSSPPPAPPPLVLIPDAASLASQLAAAHTPAALVSAALRTHGLWADAAALGVFDDRLWHTIDFAWRVLLGAIERTAPSPSVSPPPASTPGCDEEMDSSGDECEEGKRMRDE